MKNKHLAGVFIAHSAPMWVLIQTAFFTVQYEKIANNFRSSLGSILVFQVFHTINPFHSRYQDQNSILFVIEPHKELIENDNFRLTPKMEELESFTVYLKDLLKTHKIPFHTIQMLDRKDRVNFVIEKLQMTKDIKYKERDTRT